MSSSLGARYLHRQTHPDVSTSHIADHSRAPVQRLQCIYVVWSKQKPLSTQSVSRADHSHNHNLWYTYTSPTPGAPPQISTSGPARIQCNRPTSPRTNVVAVLVHERCMRLGLGFGFVAPIAIEDFDCTDGKIIRLALTLTHLLSQSSHLIAHASTRVQQPIGWAYQ